jgi:hypothetical protein
MHSAVRQKAVRGDLMKTEAEKAESHRSLAKCDPYLPWQNATPIYYV